MEFSAMVPPLGKCTLLAINELLAPNLDSPPIIATPVQTHTIPLLLTNKDVCVQAVTGSGKTLAFVIPVIELTLRHLPPVKKRQITSIVVSPTRELAAQTHAVFRTFTRHNNLSPPLLLVGQSRTVKEDLLAFSREGSDIIVGTPGRLADVITRYDTIDTTELEILILDEADTLLAMGFEVQLNSLLQSLPKQRRTGLFSATQKKGVKVLARAGLRNPIVINVKINLTGAHDLAPAVPVPVPSSNPQISATATTTTTTTTKTTKNSSTPQSLLNYYIITSTEKKLNYLINFLYQHNTEKSIVFFLTCASAEFFGNALSQLNSKSKSSHKINYLEPLHGKMAQKRRDHALLRFKEAKSGALFCTDVASRGLDVNDIDWVVQFDPPTDPSSYVHRAGRAARAGRMGKGLIMLTNEEDSYVDFLKLRRVPLLPLPEDSFILGSETSPFEIKNILADVRNIVLQDREFLENGTKAFTSFVRAYKEHQCQFIFRFSQLDLGSLANSFCLLRLPKMPELKHVHVNSSFQSAGREIDIYAIPFKDKIREKSRQKRLVAELAAGGNQKKKKAEQRLVEKKVKHDERIKEAKEKGRTIKKDGSIKKRGRQQQIFEDWDNLAEEERMFKKLKKHLGKKKAIKES